MGEPPLEMGTTSSTSGDSGMPCGRLVSTGAPQSQQWDSSRRTRALIFTRAEYFSYRGFEVEAGLIFRATLHLALIDRHPQPLRRQGVGYDGGMSRTYPALGSRPARLAVTLALAVATLPLLAACGGAAGAAHDSCMGEAASQAGSIEGVGASEFEGDYDLMGLCDELVGAFEGDEGRVVHAVGCVADYVESNIEGDGVFSSAYRDGSTVPDLMDDPFSIGACV